MKHILPIGIVAMLALPVSANALDISVSWQGIKACYSESPAFKLKGVPKGTAILRFNMSDLDAPNYPHGGGDVQYTGQAHVPVGAFTYNGPCPPGVPHQYQWFVKALDSSGQVLDSGKTVSQFPPK